MTRHIYIVDDDESVRASTHSLLSRIDGLAVRSYRSGDAFLEAVPELDPGVVLLDMHMPGATGLDVLRATNKGDDTRFVSIVITGQGDTHLAVESMKAGAVDFIEKPFDHRELLSIIDSSYERLEQQTQAVERQRDARERVASLSPRERDVLDGLIEGRANKVIAIEHGISPRTIEIYRANLMTKLNATTLSDVLRIAFQAGIVGEV
ncbi:MAG: response regulator [Novosphingobium sp.]|nr:response regulator [Novosphingobium sp.]